MMDHIRLLGSEDIIRAGNAMKSAAEDMLRAANLIDEAHVRQRAFMDDWLARFERAMENAK